MPRRHPTEVAIVYNPGAGVPGDLASSARAIFIDGRGIGITAAMEDALGRDEIGPAPHCPAGLGLWLWFGVPAYVRESSEGVDEGGYFDYARRGMWRRLTPREHRVFAMEGMPGLLALLGPLTPREAAPDSGASVEARWNAGDLLVDILGPPAPVAVPPAPPTPQQMAALHPGPHITQRPRFMPPGDSRPMQMADAPAPPPNPVAALMQALRTGARPPAPAPLPLPAADLLARVRVHSLMFVPVAQQRDEIVTDEIQIEAAKRMLESLAQAAERNLAALQPTDAGYADAMAEHQRALKETYLEGRRTILVKRRIT